MVGVKTLHHSPGDKIGDCEILSIRSDEYYIKYASLLCSCGKTFERDLSRFKNSATKSCGCMRISKPKGTLVYGVGLNDSGTNIRNKGYKCPFYNKWLQMLHRCYSPERVDTHPSYNKTVVCEEWHTFSSFKDWMEKQDWEGKELDKDLLGNGELYSPETCCFLEKEVNGFIRDNDATGYYVVDKHKFLASVKHPILKKKVSGGRFNSLEEATEGWRKTKRKIAEEVIRHFKLEGIIAEKLRERYDG